MTEFTKDISANAYRTDTLGDVRPKIVIGGKTGFFVPNLNASFEFDSGVEKHYINLNRKSVSVTDEKESFLSGELALSVGSETDIWHVDETGRLKWDISFASKPASNVIEWELKCSPGITFHKQPLLPAEDEAGAIHQPEDVIGSYAVYINQRGHFLDSAGKTVANYRTGKITHIYRPLCIDADGIREWAELDIEKGVLRITIPQKYLDACAYPMRLDPTFGLTTVGASEGTTNDDFAHGSYFSSGAAGTATKLSVYDRVTFGSATGKAAIQGYVSYISVGAPLANGTTSEVTINSTTPAWLDFTFPSSPTLENTTYYLTWNTLGNDTYRYFDTVADAGGYASLAYTSYPGSGFSLGDHNRQYSIYCTYTAAGAAAYPYHIFNQ